jgi:hypothetical protein
MNERIKDLGIQAGGIWIEHATAFLSGTLNLERFAELVLQNYISQIMTTEEREQFIRQDEREACIDIVIQNVSPAMARECEDAIKARGNHD